MEMTQKFGAGAEKLKSIFMEMTEGNDVPWIYMSYKLYIITKSPWKHDISYQFPSIRPNCFTETKKTRLQSAVTPEKNKNALK